MNKPARVVAAGVVGTVIMSATAMLVHLLGGPKMSAPHMVSSMMGMPEAVGWMMHFGIGIAFAGLYALLLGPALRPLRNPLGRGVAFGVVAFILAQVSIVAMSKVFGRTPPVPAGMAVMAVASMLQHVIFGVSVAVSIDAASPARASA